MSAVDDKKIRNVFVTVGTTSFDELIKVLIDNHDELKDILAEIGCSKITIQYGRGTVVPDKLINVVETVEIFQFKPSLDKEIDEADLVISHAGAGSILESLRKKKKLLVVVNETLMDNHQLELAQALRNKEYLECAHSTKQVMSKLRSLSPKNPDRLITKEYPPKASGVFANMVDKLMDE